MITLILSSAIATPIVQSAGPTRCEISAFWQTVDESVLDRQAPAGTQAITVPVGCRFVSPPGAIVDLDVSGRKLSGLPVLGIRRIAGQVIVAARPEQAKVLRGQARAVDFTVVREGDWRSLIMEVNRLHWAD